MASSCVGKGCSLRIKDAAKTNRTFKSISSANLKWLRDILISEGIDSSSLSSESRVCIKCFQRYRRLKDNLENKDDHDCENPDPKRVALDNSAKDAAAYDVVDSNDSEMLQDDSEDSVPIFENGFPLLTVDSLYYGPSSNRRCSICKKYSDDELSIINETARIDLMFYHKLWCPSGSRVCKEHLIANTILPGLCVDLSCHEPLTSQFPSRSAEIINDLLKVSHSLSQAMPNPKPTLDYEMLSDEDLKAWTGWSRSEFISIHDNCSSKLTNCDSSYNAMLLFWTKLKTNISWPQLGALLGGMPKYQVSRTFHMVLSALNETIVPSHLGTHHLSREDAMSHNTAFTKAFYGDNVTLVLDGTYIYIQKSSDHQLQKSSYCGQKKRNYLKFMSVVLPDGYVVDSIGPFYGNENDASITKQILSSVDSVKRWLHDNDTIIVDRGFRDVLDLLESAGYKTEMPSFLPKGETQHSTLTANEDRMCTKTRWVVESYHGRMKGWKIFKEQLSSNFFINIIQHLVRIITACLNCVRGPIYQQSPERDHKDQLLAARMKERLSHPNVLAERVKADKDLSRKAASLWKKLDASEISFPSIDLEYLETVACGTYQVKQASGYISEHLTAGGDFEIWVYQHSDNLIRGQIRSRHKSQLKYNVWISFDNTDTQDPVKDYYCQCPAGSRTVGMCAHTASILYYVGHITHQRKCRQFQTKTKQFKQALMSKTKT